jgi:hypothetical protein
MKKTELKKQAVKKLKNLSEWIKAIPRRYDPEYEETI